MLKERPLFIGEKHLEFYSSTETRINSTLQFLMSKAGLNSISDEKTSKFDIETDINTFLKVWTKISEPFEDIDFHLENLLLSSPVLLDFSKGEFICP